MGEAGRPTDMTSELVKKIKQSILDGNDLKTTAKICGIDEQKIYNWKYDNYLNISDKIEGWKRDRKLMLAEKNIEEFLTMTDTNIKETERGIKEFKDSQLTRIKADISKFVAETLGRNDYSKRNELSGPNGKELQPVLVKFINNKDDADDNQHTAGIQEAV